MAEGTAARVAAFEILSAVRAGRSFDAALEGALTRLNDPDRRLAHEIAAGVLRTRGDLDAHLAPLVTHGWQRTAPDLRDLLRIGAYQLLWLGRVPPYAAVQSTVEVAKSQRGTRSAGLVNAVLRRLTDSDRARSPDAAHAGPAEEHSHPDWLVQRWSGRYGVAKTEALLRHNNQRPNLTVQPLRWTRDEVRGAFAARDLEVRDAPYGDGVVINTTRVPDLPGYDDGAFVVQDAAQARLLAFADVADGTHVWDPCAAPGGKAALLSRRTRVVASDYRLDRLALLRSTLTRTRANVVVVASDACRPPFGAMRFDVVLVDAPCSATGTMVRHPDIRWRLSPERVQWLAARQGEILESVSASVRTRGLLVYLTCSLEPEENEEQVDRFLEQHRDFTREGSDLLIFPSDAGTDGGYGARLRRAG